MRQVGYAFLSVLLAAASAASAESGLTGEWADQDGYAHIRIENCGGRYWGAVSWEKEPGGVDKKNPDASKRGEPTLGMPVLLAMKEVEPNHGEGEIYNSQNGKTYSGSITLTGRNRLKVRGCVLGFLCGGQEWRRVGATQKADEAQATSEPSEFATQSPEEFCSNIERRTAE
jgi:uncharacterized protein (DUF2147 family)